jgi:hypothetical protein
MFAASVATVASTSFLSRETMEADVRAQLADLPISYSSCSATEALLQIREIVVSGTEVAVRPA